MWRFITGWRKTHVLRPIRTEHSLLEYNYSAFSFHVNSGSTTHIASHNIESHNNIFKGFK